MSLFSMTEGQQTADATQSPIPRTSVARNKFFWLALMLAAALVVSALLTNTYLVTMLGVLAVLMVVAFMVRGKAMYWCVAAVATYGLITVALNSTVRIETPAAKAKHNLHAIQMALERYSVDHETYPLYFSSLAEEGYLPKTPKNPYRTLPKTAEEKAMSDEEWDEYSRMRPLLNHYSTSPGHEPDPDSFEGTSILGDFVYIPYVRQRGSGYSEVHTFSLSLFYSPTGFPGDPSDRVEVYYLEEKYAWRYPLKPTEMPPEYYE